MAPQKVTDPKKITEMSQIVYEIIMKSLLNPNGCTIVLNDGREISNIRSAGGSTEFNFRNVLEKKGQGDFSASIRVQNEEGQTCEIDVVKIKEII